MKFSLKPFHCFTVTIPLGCLETNIYLEFEKERLIMRVPFPESEFNKERWMGSRGT